jgi:uncharacterized protein involved in type VI secretion and phage assembly
MSFKELTLSVRLPWENTDAAPFFEVEEFCGREAISRLFNFQLTLLADNWKVKDFGFEQVLGQSVTVTLRFPGGGGGR